MDIKKWFGKIKKNGSQSGKRGTAIYSFLDKEGFYIILFLCVCIVATTAVWVTKANIDRLAAEDAQLPPILDNNAGSTELVNDDLILNNDVIEQIKEDEKIVPTVASTAQEKPAPVKENQPSQQAENTVDAEEVMSNQKQTATSAMTVPLVGSIGMKYAVDSLVYSKTLDQFTTHEGIDIIAPINTPVMAAQAGEVIEVVVDSRLGITIAIAHEGNIITRYSNLSTDQMVEVGDFVERGEVISGVGRSALFSIAEEPHLHFEVLVEGKNVDPSLYIPIE